MRSLSTLLVFLWALSDPAPGPAGELFRRGDSSGDGRVDVSDPVAVLIYLFDGGSLGCLDGADAGDDGRVDLSDAIGVLGYLFLSGPPPAPPGDGPCPGPDPTPDGLGCARGEPEPADLPRIAFWPEGAPAPGSRARLGIALDSAGGTYRIGEGLSFVLVVEAASNELSGARFALEDPETPGAGNPQALRVFSDRALGDPAGGGAPAGQNLAGFFLKDIDLWSDRVFLIDRAAMLVDARTPLGPPPGRYRFQAQVVDAGCAASPLASFDLEVEASRAPQVHLWLEDDAAGAPSGVPRAPSAATGGLALAPAEPAHLVVRAFPNPRAVSQEEATAAVDPATFRFFADPPILPGTLPLEDLAARFRSAAGAVDGSFTWSLRLDPGAGSPAKGNALLRAEVAARGGDSAAARQVLEVEVSYAGDIQPIWTRECTGCHERPQLEKGLELVGPLPQRTHRNVVSVFAAEPAIDSAAPLLIRPYRPDESYLIHKLLGTQLGPPVLGSGDRMPADGPPYLPEETIRLIRDWTSQGARNN